MATGLVLAWAGLALPWRHWSATAVEESEEITSVAGSISGFAEARSFWIVLAIVTPVAIAVVVRPMRWVIVAVAVGAVVLAGLAVRKVDDAVSDATTFVSVGPGLGLVLSLAGVLALLGGALAYAGPRPRRIAVAIGALAVVVVAAAALPRDDGRPAAGRIATVADLSAQALTFDGGTLYATSLGDSAVTAVPAAGRSYDVADLEEPVWRQGGPPRLTPGSAGLAIQGDELYVGMWGPDRLVSASPDGTPRVRVARSPRKDLGEQELPNPRGGRTALVVAGFHPERLAAAAGGGVYVLQENAVALWRGGRLQTVGGDLDEPQDIAAGRDGRLYIADTYNGRVRRVDPDGTVSTIVGTQAPPGCVRQGLDDPLALDTRACIGVKALAVDSAGNLYLSVRGVARIVGVTADGRMGHVAGAGPIGSRTTGRDATEERVGDVHAMAVGPDGDLYLAETEPVSRIRRIADPAGILDREALG